MMTPTERAKMILAYLQEDRLTIEEQIEVLKSALRIAEKNQSEEELNRPNRQIKMFEV